MAAGITGDFTQRRDRNLFTVDQIAFSTPAKLRPRVRFLRSGFFTAIFSLLPERRAEPPGKSKAGAFAEPAGGRCNRRRLQALAAVPEWVHRRCRKLGHQFRHRRTD